MIHDERENNCIPVLETNYSLISVSLLWGGRRYFFIVFSSLQTSVRTFKGKKDSIMVKQASLMRFLFMIVK